MNTAFTLDDIADMAFFRRAMNRARRCGDYDAARRWADRLNALNYKHQAARDRAVNVASMRSASRRCITDIAAPLSVTVAVVTNSPRSQCDAPGGDES